MGNIHTTGPNQALIVSGEQSFSSFASNRYKNPIRRKVRQGEKINKMPKILTLFPVTVALSHYVIVSFDVDALVCASFSIPC